MDYCTQLLSRLVSMDTDSETKKGYGECANFIAEEARKLRLKPKIVFAPAPDKKPRPNVLIEYSIGMDKTVVFAAHYDTVPAGKGWKTDPFKLTRKGGRLFGRGASDNKGAIAVALSALKKLKQRGKSNVNVKLIFSCDEEVGSEFGLRYLCEKRKKEIDGDLAIVLDAGSRYIGIGCSAAVLGKIFIKGEQGHAGYPHKARNVLNSVIPFLNDLKDYSKEREKVLSKLDAQPGSPKKKVWGRFNITMLNAGVKENVFPPEAMVGFDLRLIPEEDEKKTLDSFKKFVGKLFKKHDLDGRVELNSHGGYFVDERESKIKKAISLIRKVSGKHVKTAASLGGTDGTFFARAGIPVLEFGPASKNSNFHGTNEFILADDLRKGGEFIKKFCENYA
ncbi:M20/M25/M40 family metallo-hydrolase [Candidatus Micrarchaeota archaeon]|nr:M20/M25/M40 family metallo-hydrolase [Candidatus Micrarchaeota archaeon]